MSANMNSISDRSTLDYMYNVPKDGVDPSSLAKVRKDLTMIPKVPDFVPKKRGSTDNAVTGFYAFGENNTHISVPRFYGIQKWGCPPQENIQVFDGIPMNSCVQFEAQLRDDPPQNLAFKAIIEALCGKDGSNRIGGAMAQLPCGYGKTILAIAIAVHLRRRTMVFVHKEFLMDQWIKRIQTFVPNAKVGKLQQNKIQIEDKDFVVAMVHSVAGRDYPKELLETIGLLIVDESHHMAAQFFSQALPKIPCKYVLGLSATPRRSDGLQRLLEWSMGKIAFAVARKVESVRVAQVIYENGQQKELSTRKGVPLRPQMLTALVGERSRNAVVLDILASIMSYGDDAVKLKKRKVLVLTDRLDHVDLLLKGTKTILGVSHYSYGKYVGGMTETQRDASAECDMIFGTYSMASEALDIPTLDTLVLATPKYDVEQAVGRILRACYGKMIPVIIDVVDPFSHYQQHGWSRRTFYVKQKYNVTRESHVTFLPKFKNWLKSVDSGDSGDSGDKNDSESLEELSDNHVTESEPWL